MKAKLGQSLRALQKLQQLQAISNKKWWNESQGEFPRRWHQICLWVKMGHHLGTMRTKSCQVLYQKMIRWPQRIMCFCFILGTDWSLQCHFADLSCMEDKPESSWLSIVISAATYFSMHKNVTRALRTRACMHASKWLWYHSHQHDKAWALHMEFFDELYTQTFHAHMLGDE